MWDISSIGARKCEAIDFRLLPERFRCRRCRPTTALQTIRAWSWPVLPQLSSTASFPRAQDLASLCTNQPLIFVGLLYITRDTTKSNKQKSGSKERSRNRQASARSKESWLRCWTLSLGRRQSPVRQNDGPKRCHGLKHGKSTEEDGQERAPEKERLLTPALLEIAPQRREPAATISNDPLQGVDSTTKNLRDQCNTWPIQFVSCWPLSQVCSLTFGRVLYRDKNESRLRNWLMVQSGPSLSSAASFPWPSRPYRTFSEDSISFPRSSNPRLLQHACLIRSSASIVMNPPSLCHFIPVVHGQRYRLWSLKKKHLEVISLQEQVLVQL
jgi:hypothetical protein